MEPIVSSIGSGVMCVSDTNETKPRNFLPELWLNIFSFMLTEERLATIPLVCRQFKELNMPFYSTYKQLHRFIPEMQIKRCGGACLYALTITEDQRVVRTELRFYGGHSGRSTFKENITDALKQDVFDALNIVSKVNVEDAEMGFYAVSDACPPYYLDSFYHSFEASRPRLVQLATIDAKALVQIFHALNDYAKTFELLKKEIVKGIPEKEGNELVATLQLTEKSSFQTEYAINTLKKIFFKDPQYLCSLPEDKLEEILKKRQTLLLTDTKVASSKVMFFLDHRKLGEGNVELEQMFPEVEHPPEHVWFAKKIGLLS